MKEMLNDLKRLVKMMSVTIACFVLYWIVMQIVYGR